jgi:hypothetical protein
MKAIAAIETSDSGLLRRNAKGQIVDLWNNPITVNVQFGPNVNLEVRSAGPDGQYGTLDDVFVGMIIPVPGGK